MKENGKKIPESDKKNIETGISDLKNALKNTNTEEIKKKTQDLVQSSMKLGEAIYKTQQKESGGKDSKKPENEKKDNVVDADFEEVKEDKEDKKDKKDKDDKDKEKRA